MSQDAPITHWIREIKCDSEGEAQQRIWEEYFGRLTALADAKLGGLKAYEEAEDVALSALKSFFVRASQGHFPKLNDRTELWPLLVTITVRKVAALYRRQFAQCRDARRNLSLEEIAGSQPTRELAEQVFDQAEELLESLNDELLSQIALLKLEGHTNREIAERIGRPISAVERKLALIRTRLASSTEGS